MFLRKIAAPSGSYSVSKSLRFRSSASGYLNRTPSVAGNRRTWTWSGWVKRGAITTPSCLFSAGGGSPWGQISFTSDGSGNGIDCSFTAGVSAGTRTNALFRDPSAWYHVLVAVDTTQATDTNRIKIYVNGVLQTLAFTNYPAQNFDTQFNNTVAHRLGANGNTSAAEFFDGYVAEVNFIDGQALTPSSFGLYDSNGIWQPIRYAGTYGTNGFYLPFSNTTSTTTLVQDSSGNGNNWTPNNISLTAGTTYDSMIDSPTVGASSSNYAVLNPILANNWWASVPRGTIQDGNLTYVTGASTEAFCNFDFVSNVGKWYFELNCSATDSSNSLTFGAASRSTFEVTYYQNGNKQINGGGASAYGATWTSGDVIGVAVDTANNQITFYKNNASQGAITNTFPTNQPVYAGAYGNSASGNYNFNFGQRPFTYTPPTGYSALNTYNLPAPSISNGAQYMAATTYTGTGASLTIANSANNTIGTTFQPDFVWMKSRSAATDHALYDVVRGTTKDLVSNSTAAETTQATGLTAFGSTGFTIGALAKINTNAATYIGWQWKAGGTGVTNTAGSITSTVSANTTAGFSIVGYTGTGANATVGHGIGVAPNMIITKVRSTSGADWTVYHSSLGATQGLFLDTTAAASTSVNYWNNTAPTSSVFSVGTSGGTNNSGNTMIAYCWAAVSGYSAFGSYTGNGSTDGPFIYTGFRPRFVMTKRTNSVSDWLIFDTSRNTYNVANSTLLPNSSAAEITDANRMIDFTANGFKVRSALAEFNGSGNNMIYAAFAENPFNSSRAR